jgi:hypothetical protein
MPMSVSNVYVSEEALIDNEIAGKLKTSAAPL